MSYEKDLRDKTILAIDDEEQACALLETIFTAMGATVLTATNGRVGLRRLYEHRPDLVILDIMMPGIDGWEVCHQIRQMTNVPIIMLSALDQEAAIIRGLDAGADDYVTKPFSQQVLLARSVALLRRAALTQDGNTPLTTYEDGYLAIDLDGHQVLVKDKPIRLSATEFRLFAYLFRHAGRVRTFAQILKNVWGEEYQDSIDYVHVYVWRLRQKLEEDPSDPVYLLTHHTIGYKFMLQF